MFNNGAVRVLVVDDHQGVRAGIVSLIDAEHPGMRVVGTAASADEALEQATAQQPDVVVLDVNLGGDDGLALIPVLHRAAPCEIVVLSSLLDPEVAAHAQRIGAHACLHKTAPAQDLLDCISAARGASSRSSLALSASGGNEAAPTHHQVAAAATRLWRGESGAVVIEYALLAALIALVMAVGVQSVGGAVAVFFDQLAELVGNALPP